MTVITPYYEPTEERFQNSKLYDTEASITPRNFGIFTKTLPEDSKYQKAFCEIKITKLAGFVGEDSIYLHPPGKELEYVKLSIVSTHSNNILSISTRLKTGHLTKGDHISLYMQDGSIIKLTIIVKTVTIGKEKMSSCFLTDDQLIYLNKNRVLKVVLYPDPEKFDKAIEITFSRNDQYNTPEEGQELFKIMANKISAAKLLLLHGD